MSEKEQFIAMLNKAGLSFLEEDSQHLDKVYVRGRHGGADFHFNKVGNLIGGEVIGDQCDFQYDRNEYSGKSNAD